MAYEMSCDEDQPKKKGKSKSGNYIGLVWAILEATLDKVYMILLTQGIEAKELNELIDCWQGKLRNVIKLKVASEYGLTGTVNEVKATVNQLLDHHFHILEWAIMNTLSSKPHGDMMVFSKRKGKLPIGVEFCKMFVKIPLPIIALLCVIYGKEHNDTIIQEMVEEYYHDCLESLLNLARVDPIDHIQMCMYQCRMDHPLKTQAHESMMDCKDDVEGHKSETTEGQGADSKDKEGGEAEEVGKEEGKSKSKQSGSRDEGANTNTNVDADAKDEDDSGEI
ncbi:hypothetical protein FRC11_003958 [Ceratobasidium sp. 423]|nr:hypothetical protein FRC11_003958 [Ceratobasidium sp. 423]